MSNNAFLAQTCMVGVVVMNESNTVSYFLEAGNLNDSNSDTFSCVAGLLSGCSGDLFELSDRSRTHTFTISPTTGHHLGFECDYNSYAASRGVIMHKVYC